MTTLAQIEQAAAPRMGPYVLHTTSSAVASTLSLLYVDKLKSNANPGGVENLYMLRRGQLLGGSTVAVAPADRQRSAATYDPIAGSVAPDRPWGVAPVATELVELHHLDPEAELRPAALSGLQRCWFEDRVSIALSSAAAERDITAAASWITSPDQVFRVQFTAAGTTLLPADVQWTEPFMKAGHVWLAGWPDQYPSTLLVTGPRPYSTWVNGADSVTGPTADADVLAVDLDLAAAAAHIEGWRLFPARLKAAADGGFQLSQQAAAAEFTRLSTTQRRRKRTDWNLTRPFGERLLSTRAR